MGRPATSIRWRPRACLHGQPPNPTAQAGEADRLRAEAAKLQQALDAKTAERDLVIGLYRKGRISAADLDRQLGQVDLEEAETRAAAADLLGRATAAEQATAHLRSTDALLARLNAQLDHALTWELKRSLLEMLVE